VLRAACDPRIHDVAAALGRRGPDGPPVQVDAVQADLATAAGFIPGSFSAVYNGTKAFVDSFSHALRDELPDTGVTVTCLMPGATDTAFFERAGMMDTRLGREDKDDPADVARVGFDAMMGGEGDVTAVASVTPASTLAAQHRKQAEPGSGTER